MTYLFICKHNQITGDFSASKLATFTMIIIQAMSILARDGASRKKLLRVVESAMPTWPPVRL